MLTRYHNFKLIFFFSFAKKLRQIVTVSRFGHLDWTADINHGISTTLNSSFAKQGVKLSYKRGTKMLKKRQSDIDLSKVFTVNRLLIYLKHKN